MKSSAKMMQKVVKGRTMIIVMKTMTGVEYNEESDSAKDNGDEYEDSPADEENEDNGDIRKLKLILKNMTKVDFDFEYNRNDMNIRTIHE